MKTHNWYQQNLAIKELTANVANRAHPNSLFVVGRNIYQAACGESNSAITYIDNFMSRTTEMKPDRRKALLDGMLFEVFFDPDGKLRQKFKMQRFQYLFALQQHADLKSSFDLIAECLLPDIGHFHVLPGKDHAVAVDIVTKDDSKKGNYVLKEVHCSGANILWMNEPDYETEPGETPPYRKMPVAEFEKYLAEEMVVPVKLLTINYASHSKNGDETVLVPYGWTTRKCP